MRLFVSVKMPCESGNHFLKDANFSAKLGEVLASQKAESVYFGVQGGQRSFTYVTQLTKESDLPTIVEPWWFMFNAEVTTTPVMNIDDLKTASASINQIVKKYS